MSKFYTNVGRYGNNILWRGYDENGKQFMKKVKFQPTLYIGVQEETGFKALTNGRNMKPSLQDSMSKAKDWIE